ncbi:MAG: M13 family metallopeptidase [Terricaulis sp.]
MLSRRLFTTSSLSLLFVASCTRATAPPAHAKYGAFGIEPANQDTNVKPGADFDAYCNGTWYKNNPIPADRSTWGWDSLLSEQANTDVKTLVQEVAQKGGPGGSNEQKIADLYNAFMDVNAINAKALAPAKPTLDAIAALADHAAIWSFVCAPASANVDFGSPFTFEFPIQLYPNIDAKNPDAYCITVSHAGLGLPDRDYYLRNDQNFPALRAQYKTHIAIQLTNIGYANAAQKADAILALETAIAHHHWAVERRRDVVATYNKKTRAELIALNATFPWDAGLQSAGLGAQQSFVVAELDTMRPLSQLVLSTPIDTWKAYLSFHFVHANARVLPAAIDNENFAFFGKILNGQPEQRERWKRAVDELDGSLGEAVGKIYVERHFPPAWKTAIQELVENMRAAYGARIDQLTWMSPETKVAAHEKLRTFRPKVGYPDKWRDYSGYEVRAGDAFGNVQRASAAEWQRQIARINQPADRGEWFMTTFTVNAYYNPTWNEIVFPAAILQPPYFDPAADAAVIYGEIGATIGHEMGHGFDDQGAKQDAQGVLRDWWNAEDVRRFSALGDKLVKQFNAFEPLPGIHINGRLTLGENIGDLGGLQVAYEAYKLSLKGQPAPVIDGMTADQRFFIGYGQSWMTKQRDEQLRNQLLSNEHAPAKYRVNGVVRNLDNWYSAFNVQPGDPLYLAPADRVLIW